MKITKEALKFLGELLLGFIFIALVMIGIKLLIAIRMAFTDAIYLEAATETIIGLIAIYFGGKWSSGFIKMWKESREKTKEKERIKNRWLVSECLIQSITILAMTNKIDADKALNYARNNDLQGLKDYLEGIGPKGEKR